MPSSMQTASQSLHKGIDDVGDRLEKKRVLTGYRGMADRIEAKGDAANLEFTDSKMAQDALRVGDTALYGTFKRGEYSNPTQWYAGAAQNLVKHPGSESAKREMKESIDLLKTSETLLGGEAMKRLKYTAGVNFELQKRRLAHDLSKENRKNNKYGLPGTGEMSVGGNTMLDDVMKKLYGNRESVDVGWNDSQDENGNLKKGVQTQVAEMLVAGATNPLLGDKQVGMEMARQIASQMQMYAKTESDYSDFRSSVKGLGSPARNWVVTNPTGMTRKQYAVYSTMFSSGGVSKTVEGANPSIGGQVKSGTSSAVDQTSAGLSEARAGMQGLLSGVKTPAELTNRVIGDDTFNKTKEVPVSPDEKGDAEYVKRFGEANDDEVKAKLTDADLDPDEVFPEMDTMTDANAQIDKEEVKKKSKAEKAVDIGEETAAAIAGPEEAEEEKEPYKMSEIDESDYQETLPVVRYMQKMQSVSKERLAGMAMTLADKTQKITDRINLVFGKVAQLAASGDISANEAKRMQLLLTKQAIFAQETENDQGIKQQSAETPTGVAWR